MVVVVHACGGDDGRPVGGSGIVVSATTGSAMNGGNTSSGSSAGGSSSSGGISSGIGGCDGSSEPPEAKLPTATSACPDFKSGEVSFSFGGREPRNVKIWTSDDPAATGGPLVFVWHSMRSTPDEAVDILSQQVIDSVVAQGGAVVAPVADVNAGFNTWHYSLGNFMVDDDMRLADEIVASAIEKKDIDTRRIHATGFGLGAMQTVQFAAWRSNYVASIVAHSTSLAGNPMEQDPDNLYAAMVVHGGAEDASGFQYNVDSKKYVDMLLGKADSAITGKHFAVLCDHGMGHEVGADVRESAYEFLLQHCYKLDPSPYQDGLPESFPAYCEVAD